MLTKAEHITYWVSQSHDDWEAVDALFIAKKYLQSLFFTHLVLERLCKAIWIKHNTLNVPPKIPNLYYILTNTPIQLTEEQGEFFLMMNRFQLEGRYPDYISDIYEFSRLLLQRISLHNQMFINYGYSRICNSKHQAFCC